MNATKTPPRRETEAEWMARVSRELEDLKQALQEILDHVKATRGGGDG